ncbi:MAG: prepilin-type N-terminal cleavage/methylation domain-containing protein [Candidatus Omnitrophota bacterium]
MEKRGFTLLEGLVVFFISTIVMGALLMMLSSGRRTWYSVDAQITLQQELRKALGQMLTDLPQSSEIQISCPSSGTLCPSLSFNVSRGVLSGGAVNWSANPINYSLSSGQILRTEGASVRVLANHIANMTFQRQAGLSRVVQINLTAQKQDQFNRTLTESLSTSVMLRN